MLTAGCRRFTCINAVYLLESGFKYTHFYRQAGAQLATQMLGPPFCLNLCHEVWFYRHA